MTGSKIFVKGQEGGEGYSYGTKSYVFPPNIGDEEYPGNMVGIWSDMCEHRFMPQDGQWELKQPKSKRSWRQVKIPDTSMKLHMAICTVVGGHIATEGVDTITQDDA